MIISFFSSRLINVPSEDLGPSESLRTEVQVWVPSQGEYRPVAHLALCGDYASRRLMTTYNCKATKNTSHVYTVSGQPGLPAVMVM